MNDTRRQYLRRALAAVGGFGAGPLIAACQVGEAGGEAGAPKTLKTGITLQWGSSGADMKVVVEALEHAQRVAQPLIQGQEIYNTIISTELRAAWSGQKSVREVVETIKARVEPMLARERA